MPRFALNKDFDSIKGGVRGSKKTLELKQFRDEYILLSHVGDYVEEIASFTAEELKTIWTMLTI